MLLSGLAPVIGHVISALGGEGGVLEAPDLGVLAAELERAASPMSTVLVVSCIAVGVCRGVELWGTEDLCEKSGTI